MEINFADIVDFLGCMASLNTWGNLVWIYAWIEISLSSFQQSTAFHCVTTHVYYSMRDSFLKGATYKHSTQVRELILNSEVSINLSSWIGERGNQNSKGLDGGGF